MNVGILYGSRQKNDDRMKSIAQALSEGIQSQGHRVDLIDMNLEAGKIVSFYDYLVVGTNNTTFFGGKIPEVVSTFLKGAGSLSGKRCMAFITGGGLRPMKTLQALMKAMEKEGMFLKKSEMIKKPELAKAIGKRVRI
ncbi:MAG: flavodoxin family protein [Spirochaetales bacterium]|nr:flavodoxin family protein [Spirochaetales bacterium]